MLCPRATRDGAGNFFAHVGVGAGALAGGIYAAGAIAAWQLPLTIPTFGQLFLPGAGGTAVVGWGITGSTVITVTGTHIIALASGGILALSVNALLDAEIIEAQAQMHNAYEGWKLFEDFALKLAEEGNWSAYIEMWELAQQLKTDYHYFQELVKAFLNIRLNIRL